MSEPTVTYEEARAELARVVERLESGGSSLEESLALWERGEHLADVCQRWLDGARSRLETARRNRHLIFLTVGWTMDHRSST